MKRRKEKSLAHAQDFEGRIRSGSRKNSIQFNRDLFILKELLYAWNHKVEKKGVGHGLCSLGINNLVTEEDPVVVEVGAVILAPGRFNKCYGRARVECL